jgi:hypothetical protein
VRLLSVPESTTGPKRNRRANPNAITVNRGVKSPLGTGTHQPRFIRNLDGAGAKIFDWRSRSPKKQASPPSRGGWPALVGTLMGASYRSYLSLSLSLSSLS